MAYRKIPEEARDLHNQLLTDLHDYINTKVDKHDFEKLKNRLKLKLTPMDLMNCEDVLQVAQRLEKKGRVSPGNYDTLIHLVECIDVTWVNFIREKAEEINKIIERDNSKPVDTGTKRKYEDEHGTEGTESQVTSSTVKKRAIDLIEKKFYKREPGQKGLVLVLNFNRGRQDVAGKDVKKIQELFEDTLKFECEIEEDLSKKHVMEYLEDTRKILNSPFRAKKYYCFIMFIMSHGDEEGIMTDDKQKIPLEDIFALFRSDKIENFAGKPRCFFIQACRGKDVQQSVDLPDEIQPNISDIVGKISIPTDADVLYAFATTPGYQAFRRANFGTWFVEVIVSTFKEYYQNMHVEEMLIDVKYQLAYDEEWRREKDRQMPCTWSTLTKRLSLNHQHS